MLLFISLWISSLTLSEAEQIAIENNPAFLIAQEKTYQAKQEKQKAISRFFPKLAWESEFQVSSQEKLYFNVFSTSDPFPASYRGYKNEFVLSQPLLSTDLIFDYTSKKFEESSLSYTQQDALISLLLSTRVQYSAVVSLSISLKIAKETVDYLKYALKQEEGKFEAGHSTSFEVNQSRVAVANAVSAYHDTLKALKKARYQLLFILGIDALQESELCLEESTLQIENIPLIQEKLDLAESTVPHLKKLSLFSDKEILSYQQLAYTLSPSLKASQSLKKSAQEQLQLHQGSYLPKLSSYLRYGYNDGILGPDTYIHQPYALVGGICFSWTLFDSLQRERSVRKARSQNTSAQLSCRQTAQRTGMLVQNSLYQFEESLFAYLAAKKGSQTAQQGQYQAQQQFSFGKISSLEYRDAIQLLRAALDLENQAALSAAHAYYELRYALGLDLKKQ